MARDFPEIPPTELMREMFVVDRQGQAHGGVQAWRILSRRIPLLWPAAVLLHIPGSLPAWNWLYQVIARNRYRFAGRCDDGSCRLP